MKPLVTEYEVIINEKNNRKRTAQNFEYFIMISSNSVPVRIWNKDRRYCNCRCSSKYANNDIYYKSLYDSLEDNIFMSHMLAFFINLNIKGFNPGAMPKTNAKEEVLEI